MAIVSEGRRPRAGSPPGCLGKRASIAVDQEHLQGGQGRQVAKTVGPPQAKAIEHEPRRAAQAKHQARAQSPCLRGGLQRRQILDAQRQAR